MVSHLNLSEKNGAIKDLFDFSISKIKLQLESVETAYIRRHNSHILQQFFLAGI